MLPALFGSWRPYFARRGAPVELLTDNATTFSRETFYRFAERWGVRMRFRCAYVPAGNGIVERSHRTIKRIAARTQCLVMEAVYWYNVTPKDNVSASTAPANIIYSYTARIRGVDVTLPPEDARPSSYEVGDSVWVKIPHGRCTTQFGKGTITVVHLPDERVTTPRRKEGRKARTRRRERKKEGERGRKRERRNSYLERGRKRSTQYALKLTTVSSLKLIQESVSCCLLCLLLTTDPILMLLIGLKIALFYLSILML